VLRHADHHGQRQSVGIGDIQSLKLLTRVAQSEQEGSVATEPVPPRYDESRSRLSAAK